MPTESKSSNVRHDLEPSAADGAINVGRTLAGIVPLIGSPLAELVNTIFGSPIAKRRDRWLVYAVEGLDQLKGQVASFNLDDLAENDQFVTTVLQATRVAIRNHQQVKLEALRNAVLNAALPNNLSEDQQLMFLAWIDALTVSHIVVLAFAQNPQKWMSENGIAAKIIKSQHFVDEDSVQQKLQENPEMYVQVIRDLTARGLIESDPIRQINSTSGPDRLTMSYLTKSGQAFINFITSPLSEAALSKANDAVEERPA